MDETGFSQKSKFEEVCCGHGFKHLWSKSVDAKFQSAITACVAANGFVIPLMFSVPDQQLN